jgi:glutathione S-transferase
MSTTSATATSPRPAAPIRLYRHPLSGHCHRVQLLLALLDLPVEFVEVDVLAGQQKLPVFLALNAFGQVPVIEDGLQVVADSNAILVYLAATYGGQHLLPADPAGAAAVQRWLSAAAGPLAFGPATARVIELFGKPDSPHEAIARAQALFSVMDKELSRSDFLAGPELSIADIANYSYTAHAPEGGVSLEPYPALRAWLARIEALPRFVAMPKSAIGLCALAA